MVENLINEHLSRMDTERMRRYRNYLDFYHGRQWEGRIERGEKRLTFNYCRVFIDKLTSYLMSGMTFNVEPVNNTPEAALKARRAEEALREVHERNNLTQLDMETETDAAVLGDGAYKVIWDAGVQQVRVTAPDVQGLYAWWMGDDVSRVWKVASLYHLTAEEAGLLYGIKAAGKQVEIVEIWTERDFQLYSDNRLLQSRPNSQGFIPFLIFPNLREPKQFWGISDLQTISSIQQEMNRAMSQLSRILELSGNPIAVLENIDQSEDITVKPGAVWTIPEDARAYLLDLLQGGGVSLHIDYINLLYRILHDLSESPRAAFGGTERDLSGVALEIELQPLLQKVARKRLIRTPVYMERARMILRLLEKHTGVDFGDYRIRVNWAPVLPRDLAHQVEIEQVLVKQGIHSRRTAMDGLGIIKPEEEFRHWLEEEQKIKEITDHDRE